MFDNLDVYVQVHDMTEEFQNQDLHWVSSMATENRVTTSSLSNEAKAEESLSKMENCLFLPDAKDHKLQRQNYTILVSRILTKHIDALKFLEDVAVTHIPHQYSKETSKSTNTVSWKCKGPFVNRNAFHSSCLLKKVFK